MDNLENKEALVAEEATEETINEFINYNGEIVREIIKRKKYSDAQLKEAKGNKICLIFGNEKNIEEAIIGDKHFSKAIKKFFIDKYLVSIYKINKNSTYSEGKIFSNIQEGFLLGEEGVNLVINSNEEIEPGIYIFLDRVKNLKKDQHGVKVLPRLEVSQDGKKKSSSCLLSDGLRRPFYLVILTKRDDVIN